MPLYDYQCAACAGTFELLTAFDARPACPQCGSPNMERLLSAPAAPGQTKKLVASARSQASREGHFSNYSPSELKRR
jgi:putative FmdB family regulatory protein